MIFVESRDKAVEIVSKCLPTPKGMFKSTLREAKMIFFSFSKQGLTPIPRLCFENYLAFFPEKYPQKCTEDKFWIERNPPPPVWEKNHPNLWAQASLMCGLKQQQYMSKKSWNCSCCKSSACASASFRVHSQADHISASIDAKRRGHSDPEVCNRREYFWKLRQKVKFVCGLVSGVSGNDF